MRNSISLRDDLGCEHSLLTITDGCNLAGDSLEREGEETRSHKGGKPPIDTPIDESFAIDCDVFRALHRLEMLNRAGTWWALVFRYSKVYSIQVKPKGHA